ncbi:MerR family transcriptional regulator [Sphingomonas turrisvirgatae]|jgi:DNA-binding transcriptional MerR regulator|nr:MerR family transcriptional regulator [Sphingomonas turrisvirgatae]
MVRLVKDVMTVGLTIGKAAEAAGVGVETVRFYEREGIIVQPIRPGGRGTRRYSPVLVEQIRFIREAQQLGFTLREVRELLALQSDPAGDCSDVRSRALAKRSEIAGKITRLQSIGAMLDELIASCPAQGALDGCTILDAIRSPASCDGRCGQSENDEDEAS